jgi:hypothetical protein
VLLDADGKIIEDARVIIYPGSNGDPWWDTKQLLAQIKTAIQIFDKAHPDCQALFVFDQSSAHASLPPEPSRLLKWTNLMAESSASNETQLFRNLI